MESRLDTKNEQDIEAGAPSNAATSSHTRPPVSKSTHAKACLALIPNALADSLYGIESLPPRFYSQSLAAGVGLLAGTASIGFNEESLIDNVRELRQVLNCQHPDEWPVLSKTRNIAALSLSALPIFLSTLLHAIQLYFKTETLSDTYPELDVIPSEVITTTAIVAAVFGGSIFFLNQGIETLKAFRKLFAPSSEASKLSSGTGIGVASMGIVVDFMLFYLIIKYSVAGIADKNDNDDESDIDLEIAKYFYLLGAGVQGITNFCYNKSFGRDSADRFLTFLFDTFEDVKNRRFTLQHAKQLFSFSTAMAMSGLLASLEKLPADNGFRECAEDFNISSSLTVDITIEILTWVTAAYLLLINTASLYDATFNITNWTLHQLYRIKETATSLLRHLGPNQEEAVLTPDKAHVPLLEETKDKEKQDATPFFSENTSLPFFKRERPSTLKKPAAEKNRDRCCTLF